MKRLFTFIVFVFTITSVITASDTIWVVKGCKTLNVREQPKTNASVLTKLHEGDVVGVVDAETHNKWTEIIINEWQTGYVSSRYIERQVTEGKAQADSKESTPNSFGLKMWSRPLKVWMTEVLLGIALVSFLLSLYSEEEEEPGIAAFASVFFSLSILMYVGYMETNALWFLNPDKSGGWGWVILHGFLFLLLLGSKLRGLYHTCQWIETTPLLGLIAFPVEFCILIYIGIKCPEYAIWVMVAYLVLQLVQAYLIVQKSGWLGAVAYLIEMFAITLLLLPGAVLGIIVGVIFLGFFLLKGVSSLSDVGDPGWISRNEVRTACDGRQYRVGKDGEVHWLSKSGEATVDDTGAIMY